MATAERIQLALGQVTDQETFLNLLLRDVLDWPIPEGTFSVEDISYEWPIEDFRAAGLEDVLAEGNIYQIQPLDPDIDQPWGIFIVQFRHSDSLLRERGMTKTLRIILSNLVVKLGRDSENPAWKREHLLFICTYDYRNFRFAYFKSPRNGHRVPPLATFGWNPPQPARTICEYNLCELEWPSPGEIEDPEKWVAKWSKAFDVEKVTRHFFDDYFDVFSRVEEELETALPDEDMRRLFTQRLFNRLMFLRFVEKKRWLSINGRTDYLQALHAAGGIDGESLYQSRILPLFFEALAVPGAQQSDAVGSVKYLNGGLFTRAPEDDQVEDIPDRVFDWIISPTGLFYRWNFTVEEATPLHIDVAVDPEMLGKVFEKLVTTRKEKGSYYTPREIVSFMCRETLKGYLGGYDNLVDEHDDSDITLPIARDLLQKLKHVRVIDPACGSGAYLVGMLHELHTLNRILDIRAEELSPRSDYNLKLSIIQNNLYGVDIEEFAANTACLRLWLSLAVEFDGDDPEPLPNLDFKIGIGDSLIAPDPNTVNLELAHAQVSQYAELKKQYIDGHLSIEEKESLAQQIEEQKEQINQWVRSGVSVGGFDWAVEFAEVFLPRPAEESITGGMNLGDELAAETIPGGFDIAIANPPYGAKVGANVRDLYFDRNSEGAQSNDTYGLFLARALQILKPGGNFSFIISDTWRTIKSHRPLRRRLLSTATIHHIVDLPNWIFDATVNTTILTLTNSVSNTEHVLVAGDLRAIAPNDWSTLAGNLIAVARQGSDAQTTSYARYSYLQSLISSHDNCSFFIASPRLYEIMATRDIPKLGSIAEVKQGLATGDNKYYIRKKANVRGTYDLVDEFLVLSMQEIANLSEVERASGVDPDQYDGRHFLPYDKGGESDPEGGWLPNFNVPTGYFIDWSRDAVHRLRTVTIADVKRNQDRDNEIRPSDETRVASRFQNERFYFRHGITFSPTGFYAPTFRLLTPTPFDKESSGIFCELYSNSYLLGVLCSSLMRYLGKQFVNHTVHAMQGDVAEYPIPEETGNLTREVASIADIIINLQTENVRYLYHETELKDLDSKVYELFDLQEQDIREIKLWLCRRYSRLSQAQGLTVEVQEIYAEHLAHAEYVMSRPVSFWNSHPMLSEIAAGEDQRLEFKVSLEWDVDRNRQNTELRAEVLKTICAFLNTNAGKLIIGVSDIGEIKGLSRDFGFCGRNRQNPDGFEQKLRSLIETRIDPVPLSHVGVQFYELPEGVICEVSVNHSDRIHHLDGEEIYVRDGNRSIKIQGRTRTDWIQSRGR